MNPRLEAFLSQIADFSNVGVPRRSPNRIPSLSPPKPRPPLPQQQLDLDNNAKLIAQFKSMRQKIKLLTKQNTQLKLNESSIHQTLQSRYKHQLTSLQQKDTQNTAALNFLRREMQQINTGIDVLKHRNQQLQTQLQHKQHLQKQMQYLQGTLISVKQSNDQLKREKEKLEEIGIMEKIELEERVKGMEVRAEVDREYTGQLEMEGNRLREKVVGLEGKIRRMVNDVEETRYDRERLNETSNKAQDLENIISELTKQKSRLKATINEQRQKRLKAQSHTMQKQQFSSLYAIQIESLQRDVAQLKKKNKKYMSRCQQKQQKAQQQAYKNIESKSKLYRSLNIFEECLGRVKRELNITGDLMTYIKSCEFKIGKLRDEDENGNSGRSRSPGRSVSRSKSKSKSRSRIQSMCVKQSPVEKKHKKSVKSNIALDSDQQKQPQPQHKHSEPDLACSSSSFTPRYLNQLLKDHHPTTKPSFSKQQLSFSHDYYDEQGFNKPLKKEDLEQLTPRSTFRDITNKQEEDPIAKKVKRQREQKEKKMREAILYKKLEGCANDREKMQIREEILRITS